MGSCYSTDRILNVNNQHHSKSVSRPTKRTFDPPIYSSSLREKLLNTPRNLQRSRRRHFHPSVLKPNHHQQPPIQQKQQLPSERIVSHYSELPLINLSESQRTNTSESLEEYDNSSINVSEYLAINDTINNSSNIVYTDTNAFYPFPINLLEPNEFVNVKVYNRVNLNTINNTTSNIRMTTSHSLQTSFELTNKFSNATTTSSSIQNSISSDSSFSYSSPSSPQNTLSTKSSLPIANKVASHKPSMLQQPKSTRFGFKPGIPVASSLPNPSLQAKQPQLQIKNPPTAISLSSGEVVAAKSSVVKRAESPGRSFLRPPMPVNGSDSKKIEKTAVVQAKLTNAVLKESSSMSSICSSASSSSYSNQTASVKKSKSNEKSVNSVIKSSGVPNPKFISKPIISPTASKLNVNTTTTNNTKAQFQSSLMKPPSVTLTNSQLKRRLFNPYPNIVSTNATATTTASARNAANPIDVDLKENSVNIATETFVKNPDENQSVNNNNDVNSNSQRKAQQLKFNPTNTNNNSAAKAKVNVINSTKASKMPTKSPNSPTTAALAASRLPAKKAYKPTALLRPLHINENQLIEQVATNSTASTDSNVLTINENNFMKREDSAYCSSTSSTVSSHDAEISKYPINHLNKSHTEESSMTVVTQASDLMADLNINENLKSNESTASTKEENTLELAESSDVLSTSSNSNTNSLSHKHQKLSRRQSIKESIGELNQLISSEEHPNISKDIIKQRRTSSTSLSERERGPMFRPPSNLPPAENSEVIQLDIETYRAILQDAQQTKVLLCKLFNMLSSNSADSQLISENQMTSSFFGSLIQNNEKADQTTQTD